MGLYLCVEYESISLGITEMRICAYEAGWVPLSDTLLPMAASILAASLERAL
jgi:hypothetical protein